MSQYQRSSRRDMAAGMGTEDCTCCVSAPLNSYTPHNPISQTAHGIINTDLFHSYSLRTFMETDPKGQLGGLECTDEVRRRIAKASQSWKCHSCGKSNLEILKECEEAATKADNVKPDVAVPKELKMG